MPVEHKPFAVYTTAGVFRSEHDTTEQAEYAAKEANAAAEALGVKARYEHDTYRPVAA